MTPQIFNFYFFSQKSVYQAVFLHDRKVKTKISLSWKQKERSRWNKKHFSSFLKSFQIQKLIKSILIHEYQHKSTGVKKNQHDSTRINTSLTRINTSPTRVNTNQHESTRVNMSPTQVNTSPTRVNRNQHESKTSLDPKKWINMARQNRNVTCQWCFPEKYDK